jgi:hypothetical protein
MKMLLKIPVAIVAWCFACAISILLVPFVSAYIVISRLFADAQSTKCILCDTESGNLSEDGVCAACADELELEYQHGMTHNYQGNSPWAILDVEYNELGKKRPQSTNIYIDFDTDAMYIATRTGGYMPVGQDGYSL